MFITRNFNSRIGNRIISGIMQRFNEDKDNKVNSNNNFLDVHTLSSANVGTSPMRISSLSNN